MENKTIFAITCCSTPELRNAQFYSTIELARKQLKLMASERKHKLGVKCWNEDKNSFSFLLGWEEHSVKFAIIELPLDVYQ
ncbi:hypothetical protein UFOVP1290_427 [uncultured Caudovirales phage]|uniref:Uncharacterized protein n=1 Tax=uncultured Caudovirales phage TaxID=2100421 RepID=A0A6J5RRJ9_9CAUD|nr:hypothetical protein UFOVP1290_427 [uncultured Caudovirales phage]